MEGKNIVKKRIKGLLGIVLSVCIFASLNGMSVYAEQKGTVFSSADELLGYIYKTGDTIGNQTGGAICVTNSSPGSILVGGGAVGADYNGDSYWAYAWIPQAAQGEEEYFYISDVSVIDNPTLTDTQKASFNEAFQSYYAWGADDLRRLIKVEFKQIFPYQIKYDYNGGTDSDHMEYMMSDEIVGGTTAITEFEPTRTGYTFKGWSRASAAQEAEYTKGRSFDYRPNESGQITVLYAVWEQAEWSLSEPVTTSGSYKFGQGLYTLRADKFRFGNDNCLYVYKKSGGSDMFWIKNAGTYNFTVIN